MKTIRDIPDLKDKKVLLRVDFDVSISKKGEIEESFRIKKQKETIDYLVEHGAHVVMVAHLHDESASFANLVPQLHILLGYEFEFIKKIELLRSSTPKLGLLDNIRHPPVGGPSEEKNDPEFAKQLATGFDYYVNNDFAVCHRNHASVSAITQFLPSCAGFVIEEEIAQLSKVIDAPKDGKIIIIGGSKASTKVPVIKNFLNKADKVLVGGVVANDILKEKGIHMGESIVDDNSAELLLGLSLDDPNLIIPEDYNVFEDKILDIGEKTIENYCDIISKAKIIIWSGPMGMFEKSGFDKGTNSIAQAIAGSKAFKVLGGGDTITAVDKINLLNKFDFVSTGGGAMLEFLAGNQLSGLKALGYYETY